jgi:hypothetical protein
VAAAKEIGDCGTCHDLKPNHLSTKSGNLRRLPPVHENKEQLKFPNEELDYQPEPDTVAGFIASMEMKVDELLAAANWTSQ